ncbi:MAG: methyl-accepting chemotaxis protein [Archaeoglobaceae archaeon]
MDGEELSKILKSDETLNKLKNLLNSFEKYNEKELESFRVEIRKKEAEILEKDKKIAQLEKELESSYLKLKEAEKRIKEAEKSQKMMEAIFRVIPKQFYLFFVDRDGKLRYINEQACEIFGRSIQEIIGRRPSELFYVDRERKRTMAEAGMKTLVERALEQGGISYESVETRYQTAKGEIPVVASGAPVRVDGEFVGMLGFFVDITKNKQQEEELKKALEVARAKEEEIKSLHDYSQKCLNEIIKGMKELRNGNLNVKLQKIKDDEFGKTFEEFNEFVDRLRQIIVKLAGDMKETSKIVAQAKEAIAQVNAGMEQISSASQQIATGSENLSRLANTSSAELKELQKLMTRISEDVNSSANFAAEASKNAASAREKGGKAISMLNEIVSSVSSAAEIVKSLEVAAKNIGKVTEKIKSIADQTNLLALNAAIEAARAGEHGRGFAVVADEVRKLAEESRKSTEEIAEIVASVQEGTRKVIEAINKVGANSEAGKEGISAALKMAEEISVAVERISKMLDEVNKNVRESVAKIESVAKSFEEVASTAEENAASSEETSAAIEEQTAAMQQITDTAKKIHEFSENILKIIAENFKILN